MEGKEQRLGHHRNMNAMRINGGQKRRVSNRTDIRGMLINVQGAGPGSLCTLSRLLTTPKVVIINPNQILKINK